MQEVFRLIERVGPTEASVLLTGESGSGKELAAHSIHECSLRRGGPFVAINCGAIPAGLIEADFSATRRAVSPARCAGMPECSSAPQGGTLLLDEVTEMPLDMQTRLLRVLETQKFYRVGANHRVHPPMCASSRRPIAARCKPCRAANFARICCTGWRCFPIDMPPLRSRGDDVDLLAEHFLAELNAQARTQKRLSALARMTLKQHPWPGNVRELKNCIERAFILGDSVSNLRR